MLASTDLTNLKEKLKTSNPYSNDLYLYVKNINPKQKGGAYIMIVEYNDKTFANVKIEKNTGDENE